MSKPNISVFLRLFILIATEPYRVQTSETLIDIAATRLMLNRLAPI
jgi:hypothetical protein